jgi:hypothetical protein
LETLAYYGNSKLCTHNKSSMEIPQKLNQAVLYDAEIPLLDIYPKY